MTPNDDAVAARLDALRSLLDTATPARHTIVRLEPLPHRNSLYAAFVAARYMAQSGEGIDPPYCALSELVRKIRDTRDRVPAVADQLRARKV